MENYASMVSKSLRSPALHVDSILTEMSGDALGQHMITIESLPSEFAMIVNP